MRIAPSPRIASVIVTEREYPAFFRETVVVNRTVVVRDRGLEFVHSITPERLEDLRQSPQPLPA